MERWKIGDVEIQRVVEFECPLVTPDVLLPQATKTNLEKHRNWLEPRLRDPISGLLIISFHSFVIRTPRHVILVDTCGGNDKTRPQKLRYHLKNWPYIENLGAAGLKTSDIDFVLLFVAILLEGGVYNCVGVGGVYNSVEATTY